MYSSWSTFLNKSIEDFELLNSNGSGLPNPPDPKAPHLENLEGDVTQLPSLVCRRATEELQLSTNTWSFLSSMGTLPVNCANVICFFFFLYANSGEYTTSKHASNYIDIN